MDSNMKAIDAFVKKVENSDKNESTELVVSSYALKRELAKRVSLKYKEQNVFTEFKKGTDVFTVKKWKKRNNPPQNNNRWNKP